MNLDSFGEAWAIAGCVTVGLYLLAYLSQDCDKPIQEEKQKESKLETLSNESQIRDYNSSNKTVTNFQDNLKAK